MSNPFADSQVGLPDHSQQFQHPNQDSTGAVDFAFDNVAQKLGGQAAEKVGGSNPFASANDWGMP